MYRDDILPIFLPLLRTMLTNEDWEVKEAGILALGAISEGMVWCCTVVYIIYILDGISSFSH